MAEKRIGFEVHKPDDAITNKVLEEEKKELNLHFILYIRTQGSQGKGGRNWILSPPKSLYV